VNKLLFVFFFFVCSHSWAQDSIVAAKKAVELQYTSPEDNASVVLKTFSKGFRKKYTNDTFVYEYKTVQQNAWDRLKEWLASVFRNLFRFTNNGDSMRFVGILLKTIAVLIVVFVIYLIVKAVLNKEGQWIFGKNSDKKIIRYSELEKNLLHVDFEKLIRNTLESGEKRLTVRYYYLWLLKMMAEKRIIEWDIEKTNTDYLSEIKSQKIKAEFGYASYLYNYIWYGEFELDDDAFEKAKNAFEKSIKSVSNE